MTGAATDPSSTRLPDLLASIVRGDPIAAAMWPAIDSDIDAFCASAEAHGVLPLVADRMRMTRAAAPGALAARVAHLAEQHAVLDLARESALRAALAALDEAGLQPLVFKGAHLAYRDYARPDLRPRVDSDVLIPPDHRARDAAHRALSALGYDSAPHVGGDFVMTQRMYVLRDGAHVRHAVDAHWRIATPQAFSRVLLHEELVRDAERIPRLGAAARGPSGPHALLIACLHRVAHHAGFDCLIWLCDIDRVARRLTADEWDRFVGLARDRQLRAVCAAGLSGAAEQLRTPVPDAGTRRPRPSWRGAGGERRVLRTAARFGDGGAARPARAVVVAGSRAPGPRAPAAPGDVHARRVRAWQPRAARVALCQAPGGGRAKVAAERADASARARHGPVTI